MSGLLTSPVTGVIVISTLLFVLLRRSWQEASGIRPTGSRRVVVMLVALFVACVAARFALLFSG